MTLRDKMLAVCADVNAQVAEREELVELIAIALLTRKNLFLLSAPGQAKSYAINAFRSRIDGARQFERLLSKQTDEEQLFGRVDLSSLIPGSVPRNVLEQDPQYQRMRDRLRTQPSSGQGVGDLPEQMERHRKALSELHGGEPQVNTAGKILEVDIVFLDDDMYSSENNKLGLGHQELLEHLKGRDPAYYYSDILVPNGNTLYDFICGR